MMTGELAARSVRVHANADFSRQSQITLLGVGGSVVDALKSAVFGGQAGGAALETDFWAGVWARVTLARTAARLV